MDIKYASTSEDAPKILTISRELINPVIKEINFKEISLRRMLFIFRIFIFLPMKRLINEIKKRFITRTDLFISF